MLRIRSSGISWISLRDATSRPRPQNGRQLRDNLTRLWAAKGRRGIGLWCVCECVSVCVSVCVCVCVCVHVNVYVCECATCEYLCMHVCLCANSWWQQCIATPGMYVRGPKIKVI